jgi:hypothetical protein
LRICDLRTKKNSFACHLCVPVQHTGTAFPTFVTFSVKKAIRNVSFAGRSMNGHSFSLSPQLTTLMFVVTGALAQMTSRYHDVYGDESIVGKVEEKDPIGSAPSFKIFF